MPATMPEIRRDPLWCDETDDDDDAESPVMISTSTITVNGVLVGLFSVIGNK